MAKDILLTQDLIKTIADELGFQFRQVENTLKLILDDCTVPFIARYRKEMTENLDEVQIRDIRDKFEYLYALNERRDAILRSIQEQGKLTPELQKKILLAKSKTDLEDLYLPFKPKKRTRGQIAAEKGLDVPAKMLLEQNEPIADLVNFFSTYVGTHDELKTLENVIKGIKDYVAETVSEISEARKEIRQWTYENAHFKSVVVDAFQEQKTKYNNYYNFVEPVKTIAAHRLMALRRGEKEEILRLSLEFETEIPTQILINHVVKSHNHDTPVGEFLRECCLDSFTRLISPSIETELRLETKNRAEEEAIEVFSKNIRKLLLLPPIPKKVVLGVDPGLRTGSKLVVVDRTGKLLDHSTIFPALDEGIDAPRNRNSVDLSLNLIQKFNVEFISIGNGTACREVENFFEKILESRKDLKIKMLIVNEAGASVYSASDIAREEFPELDITYRGAVSIARRLQDPLAELVKIDPKSIGVGQYQHDVNQTQLKKKLEEVVESCVNYVGVNLNTASPSLLSYVAGIGPTLSKNIVRYREANGEFAERQDLFKVTGFGAKTFEQCAGFLRIPDGKVSLDRTAVHPESYKIVEAMAKDLNVDVADLIGKKELVSRIAVSKYTTEEAGELTLNDILKELTKPGRDPREDGVKHNYTREVRDFEQLQAGQVLEGTVTNVTNFGAFVDIGVHQDGLVHISELSTQFIKDASQAVSVGDHVKVKVIDVDKQRRRISLSIKALQEGGSTKPTSRETSSSRPGEVGHQRNNQRPQYKDNQAPRNTSSPMASATFKRSDKSSARQQDSGPSSMQDLLAKFNSHRV